MPGEYNVWCITDFIQNTDDILDILEDWKNDFPEFIQDAKPDECELADKELHEAYKNFVKALQQAQKTAQTKLNDH